jgi:pimeloyl-ACP methyl ester carboxylesterase
MFATTSIIGYFSINKPFSPDEEKYFKSIDFGKKIKVNGHIMNYEIFGENNSTTIIYLTGYNNFAPIMEFKPFAKKLSDKYRIVIIEPFGYGLSDIVDEERTLENVASEYHAAIKEIGLEKYYLMGHSIGGLYSLQLANQYPDEVLGFIGIDSTVPNQEDVAKLFNIPLQTVFKFVLCMTKGCNKIGLTNLIEKKNPNAMLPIDEDYTEEEYKAFRISKRRNSNKTLFNEINNLENNLIKARELKFPENVPVLNLIAFDKGKYNELWKKLHHDVITETVRSKVIVLEGTHLLHHDNKEGFLKEVREWVN